jgi:hypothetical protein
MKASEFKAWLEGFSEAIKGSPTKEQWEKIKKKASELQDDSPVYYPYYGPWYYTYPNPWWTGNYTITADDAATKTFDFTNLSSTASTYMTVTDGSQVQN